MDIIEKIGDTITEKGKVAADKAKELAIADGNIDKTEYLEKNWRLLQI